ncbi:unnamed protein product [Parajaminaea phylloscopi]
MAAHAKSSKKDSVEAFLSDLDNLGVEDTSSHVDSPARASASTGAEGSSSAYSQPRQPTKQPEGKQDSSQPNQGDSATDLVGDDAQSLLADLDSLVQQRRAPTPRRAAGASEAATVEAAKSAPGPAADTSQTIASASAAHTDKGSTLQAPATGAGQSSVAQAADTATGAESAGKGWGGWWSSAAKLADQARAEIERRAQSEQAKELGQRGWDLAQGVRGFVKETGWEKLGEDLGRVGKRGWTEVINAVAPPIAAHEVIQVTLSHDMVGFDGVPDVTFKVLARVMESQQLGRHGVDQQLIVNKAPEPVAESNRDDAGSTSGNADEQRNMKAVQGFAEAWQTADASVSALIGAHEPRAPKKADDATTPVTYCPVFLRIQACQAPIPGLPAANSESGTSHAGATTAGASDTSSQDCIYFLVLLQDPSHGLSHRSISQSVPASWLTLNFEDNPWIEQSLVDALEGALSVVAQAYVDGRQSGSSRSTAAPS